MSSPLRIAVVGDSVAWGQGLVDGDKFTSAVADALGGSVDWMMAHSGAVIGAGAAVPVQTGRTPEIPMPAPTILQQLAAIANPAQADLLIVVGGINDVGIFRILDPLTFPLHLRDATASACGEGMRRLLLTAAGLFSKPSCRIVVVGYFPILSGRSDFSPIGGRDPLAELLNIVGVRSEWR